MVERLQRRIGRAVGAGLVVLAALAAAGGCQPQPGAKQPSQPTRTVSVRQGGTMAAPSAQAPQQAPVRQAPDPSDPFSGARAVASSFDPCADRLHEIAGMLLVYFAQNRQLPERLEDLGVPPGAAAAAADPGQFFRCPASGKRYVYNPHGPQVGTGASGSHLIVYDAVPAHEGARWGIAVAEPKGNEPLQGRVIVIPETMLPVAVPVPGE